jgi:iron complex outermembrane receptor protein
MNKVELVFAARVDFNQALSEDTFRLVKKDIHYFDDLSSHFFNISLSAGLRAKLLSWLWVNAGLGRGTRSPSVLERYIKLMPVQYDSYDYLGNPQLKPETNHQADVSFDIPVNGIGTFSAGGFFSLVTGYITGEVIPPSVIKPSTQGAPGVKQFINRDLVYITGFEAAYKSPAEKRWGLQASVSATYGTDPDAVKYIISGGQVVGQETVKNDPLAEIPPLEGTMVVSYRFLKGTVIPRATLRMVSEQTRVSQSYGEPATPGFVTAGLVIQYVPCRFASFSAGVENMLNQPYYEHLNRRIVGSTDRLYEPGRVWYITARVGF